MSTSLIAQLIIHCLALIFPGVVICNFLKFDRYNLLYSLGFSYAFFVFLFLTFKLLGLGGKIFVLFFFSAVAVSILIIAVDWLRSFRNNFLGNMRDSILDNGAVYTFLIIVISAVYHFYFGVYSELFSDLYAHMGRVQAALRDIKSNSLGAEIGFLKMFFQGSNVHYYIPASIAYLTGASSSEILFAGSFVGGTSFLIAVFLFSKSVFSDMESSTAAALVVTVLVFLHFGVSVFSYVRYYAVAPTMACMLLYFVALDFFFNIIKDEITFRVFKSYMIIASMVLVAMASHIQEAIFIVVMLSTSAFIVLFSKFSFLRLEVRANYLQAILVSFFAFISFCILYIYASSSLEKSPNHHWKLWVFCESEVSLLPDCTILNLKKEFIQVITLWGGVIVCFFLFFFKEFKKNIFILAGMATPFVTFLNPFFVDLFLRFYNATTLWRLSFLMPIHFIAGYLFVRFFEGALLHCRYKIAFALLFCSISFMVLQGNRPSYLHYSRIPTLLKTHPQASFEYIEDLLEFLSTIESPERVLTDPMTGYVVSAMTKHINLRYKFHEGVYFKKFTFESYDGLPLTRYNDYLLIVNRRWPIQSKIGELSGHWNPDQWNYAKHYYPEELLNHLESNPTIFKVLWQNQSIAVYRIVHR